MEQMEIGVCHKLELRNEGGKLYAEGPLVVYGDRAKLGAGRTEVFTPGSMAVAEFVRANRMHNPSLLLATTNSGLEVERRAEGIFASVPLPDTTDGNDTRTMIQDGILDGFSGEFRVHEQRWIQGVHRQIMHATLYGLGIVDKAAYGLSKMQLVNRMAALQSDPMSARSNFMDRWVF